MKNRVLSSLLVVAIMASSGAAFAADNSPEKVVSHQVVTLTKDQKKTIIKECKEANKTDKKAFKACVHEKKQAAATGK